MSKVRFIGTDTILFEVSVDGKKRLYEAQNPERFLALYNSKAPGAHCSKGKFKVSKEGCLFSELFVAVPVMDTVLLRKLNFDSVDLVRHR